jgi:hypothetical protein
MPVNATNCHRRSRLVVAALFAASLLALWPAEARAVPMLFDVVGVSDQTVKASVRFAYTPSSGRIDIQLTNTSTAFDPRATGFAFNAPAAVTGVSAFSGPIGWRYQFSPNAISAPGRFGLFDVAGLTGPNLNGGNPNSGVARNQSRNFAFTLTGTGLGSLTEMDFLGLFSASPLSPAAPAVPQFFLVRFQRVGANGGGSDVAIPGGTPRVVPEPALLALFAAAAFVGARRLRRR